MNWNPYMYPPPWPSPPQQSHPFEKEYSKVMKKLLKKHFGEEKKPDEKKKSRWDGVTKAEVAFIILAFTPVWIPMYIGAIGISIQITKTLLQGL